MLTSLCKGGVFSKGRLVKVSPLGWVGKVEMRLFANLPTTSREDGPRGGLFDGVEGLDVDGDFEVAGADGGGG